MGEKILVAGGTGFIGSHIVSELWKAGRPVRILSRHADDARGKLGEGVEIAKGDIRDPQTLAKALRGIETVINCVQFPNHPIENPSKGYTYEKFDGEGTRNLVAAAREARSVKRFLYLSGAGVRQGRPNLAHEPWFRAKLMAEHAIIESGIPYTIFRPSWVYGREDRSLNKFVKFAQSLPFVPVIGDGKNKIQPLFILDLARIIVQAIDNPKAINQIYEVGGPDTLTMDQVVSEALRVIGKHKPIVHHPVWFMKMASGPMRILPKPPLSPAAIDFITMEELVDNEKLLNDFKIELTPLGKALATYLNSSHAA